MRSMSEMARSSEPLSISTSLHDSIAASKSPESKASLGGDEMLVNVLRA